MKVLDAAFVKSCARLEQCPADGRPELACVGRSNVGKSSLINSLLHRKALAKVSRTPGKTRLLNFFSITTSDPALRHFYLVDLPGYGYAKVSRSVREEWGPLLERYVADRAPLRAVLLLVDARGPQPQDELTYRWLIDIGRRPIVVATKIDKFARGAQARALESVRAVLGIDAEVLPYSSVTREGTDELWQVIRKAMLNREGGKGARGLSSADGGPDGSADVHHADGR
ncbi:ribosome biogenesis GTP-binding protein YihA/YsxC [Candidatus Nitrospira bockiana]